MKKFKELSLLLALGLSMTALVACNNQQAPAENTKDANTEVAQNEEEEKVETADNEKSDSTKDESKDTKEKMEEKTDDKKDSEDQKDNSGKFIGIAPGYGSDIKVEVTMNDGKIDNIDVIDDLETVGVGKVALNIIKDKIIEGQSTNVEAVTGATASSKGMMMAVGNALEEANIADDFKEEYIAKREYPKELDSDVVIIGGGGAGLAAAVEAIQNGSSVIVIEKNGYVGGNTILAGGIYNAPDPEKQEAQGIEDSADLYYEQTFEAGDEKADPKLVRILADNAYDGLKWLEDLGVEFEEKVIQGPGSLYPRSHQAIKPNGTGMIEAYEKNLSDSDKYTLLTETNATKLIMEDGRVVGVVAENHDGSEVDIKANKAVIITTGGFSKNPDLVLEYKDDEKWPTLDENTISTNLGSITGDGIIMGKDVGADLVDMDQMQFLYLGVPKKGQITGLVDLGAERTLFVNKEGKRFVREDGRRDDISKAIFDQKDGEMRLMHSSDDLDFDNETTLEGENFKEVLEEGKYGWVSANTLEELAEKMDVPYENLQKTIDDYNKAVDSGSDEFDRENLTVKFEKGPFAAVPRVPSLHHTMGGLKIDTETHVLDKDGNIIPGLYAAGEVTGDIHGGNRVGGNAIVDTVVFGRIAGENASKDGK